MKSRDPDHPGQHDETLSLLKIQKLARHGSTCLQSQLLRSLRQNCLKQKVEAAVSQDHATAFQPGQPSKTPSPKNKKKGRKKEKEGWVQWLNTVTPALWEA